jgi:hypothetical protein
VHDPVAGDRVSNRDSPPRGPGQFHPRGRLRTLMDDAQGRQAFSSAGMSRSQKTAQGEAHFDMGLRAMSLEEVYRACPDISLAGSPQAPGAPT